MFGPQLITAWSNVKFIKPVSNFESISYTLSLFVIDRILIVDICKLMDNYEEKNLNTTELESKFNRLSNNLLYDTCKIVDHNPNRIELLYFVDRYNWLVNFEILKNKSQCTIMS